ncbi:MAG: glycosyltransferase family 1 protein [Acidimicrobiia bacterium]|nr:MAG: glycosyltransferase family 1 protein [Acidimicrobiia bacterium]
MHLAFLNPQGNFDPADSHLTAHPDFGGQLVYVKQVALALGKAGHRVDIITRLIDDPKWPEFSSVEDVYPGAANVRIIRIPAGDTNAFLAKEELWPFLVRDWVTNIRERYGADLPDAFTGHYGDGGIAAVLLREQTGVPFTFTAHSLGAQKLDKLLPDAEHLEALENQYHFGVRIAAERLSMNHSGVNVVSTNLERDEQYAHPRYQDAVDADDLTRFAVVPPGVNLETFDRDSESPVDREMADFVSERIEAATGRRAGLPVVVASSRLDPKKNIGGLVEAYASSPALQRSANLLLITGSLDDPFTDDGSATALERTEIRRIRGVIQDAGLEGMVVAFGIQGQNKLAAAYRHLAQHGGVFALTALYEPFGLAPLEAAASGLAVVATRNGGPSESLIDADGEYGVLVDPADPYDIAAGLERALGDEWETLAAAGRQRVHDRYTWDRTAEGYLAAVERALEPTERDLLPIDPFFLGEGTEPPEL